MDEKYWNIKDLSDQIIRFKNLIKQLQERATDLNFKPKMTVLSKFVHDLKAEKELIEQPLKSENVEKKPKNMIDIYDDRNIFKRELEFLIKRIKNKEKFVKDERFDTIEVRREISRDLRNLKYVEKMFESQVETLFESFQGSVKQLLSNQGKDKRKDEKVESIEIKEHLKKQEDEHLEQLKSAFKNLDLIDKSMEYPMKNFHRKDSNTNKSIVLYKNKVYDSISSLLKSYGNEEQVDSEMEDSDSAVYSNARFECFSMNFEIKYAFDFAIIKNFRLGTLPSCNVDWSEINSAWTHTALLLIYLFDKMNVFPKQYKIVADSTHYSYIEVYKGTKIKRLKLCGFKEFKCQWYVEFDAAMCAFLECMMELEQHIKARCQGTWSMPYKMVKWKLIDWMDGAKYPIT